MSFFLLFILAFVIIMLLLYTIMEWRASRKGALRASLKKSEPLDKLPSVSVLLPVYNERLVVKKLLKAVAALNYPPQLLEILVLDDSTDECSDLITKTTEEIQGQGINIIQLRRKNRIGFKAGNLTFGLAHAKGELIAIFDADCRPKADFLKATVPFFADKRLGFLQTGIAYDNADKSFLTHFQSLEAGHKDEVSTGLVKDNYMASLTGSACVWRRSCINCIGGISSDTITEDVDMGYAAQLENWRCLYLPEALANAELPETMAAFRVQRQRWARGLIHNAIRHAGKLFASPMKFWAKLNAASLVFSPLLLAMFYLILLISPFVALATASLGHTFDALCIIFLLTAICWGWINTSSAASNRAEKSSIWVKLGNFAGYLLMFFPLSLYYMSAIIQLASGKRQAFHHTPKGYGRKRTKQPLINYILCTLELISLLYALITIGLAIIYENYWVLLYDSLAAAGFSLSLFLSLMDFFPVSDPPCHILISGASGSIGQAMAKNYANPGVRLTLLGRDVKKLNEISKICTEKGADVQLVQLDMREIEKLRNFGQELSQTDPPDLIIANAGINTNIGENAAGEKWEDTEKLIQVNILSTMALIDSLLPALRKKGSGQIAIMSSLASYYGLPHTPSYCGSKAALRIWGGALRGWLQKEGIKVNVILPGYVDSPMCRAMPGPKPFLWSPEKAAKVIRKGLEHNQARISFPFPLNLGIWLLSLLPACLAIPIARILGYGR